MTSPRLRAKKAALGVAAVSTAAVTVLLAAAAVVAGHETLNRDRAGSAPASPLLRASVPPMNVPVAYGELMEWPPPGEGHEKVRWRNSTSLGLPFEGGRLVRGVQIPSEGRHFFTWDPIEHESPNRGWRRFGHDRLVRLTLRVIRQHRERHPGAPRVAVGDLSRPRGGDFGPQFGSIGHASHQNGLDVDIYYPRRDEVERAPRTVSQVDLRLAQDLVDRFVSAGASDVFVGPNTPLTGPSDVVQPAPHHDNHLHVRIPDPD